jgi:PAS domain S-box-containing protein
MGSGWAVKGMSAFRDTPIRIKLTIIIVLAIAFAILVAGAAVLVYESRTFKPRSLEKLAGQGEILAEVLVPSLLFQDSVAASEYLGTLRHWKEIRGAAVYDQQGRLFAAYAVKGAKRNRIPQVAPNPGAEFSALELGYCLIISKEGDGAIGYLWLDQELLPLYARLPQYGIMFAVVTLSLAAVAVMLGLALKRSVTLPITSLSGTARSVIEKQDYSLRAVSRGRDEIGDLTEAFNGMLEGIELRDQSLRNSEERFSKAFLASPIPIAIVRNPERTFLDINGSNLALLGCRREDVIGRSALELGFVTPSENDRIMKAMEAQGSLRNLEVKIRTKSGAERIILLSMESIHVNGENCFLATSDDISERLQTEEKLRQSQKMEAIGLLAGGVAHDFNNLLTAIIGYSSMALEGLPPSHRLHRPLNQVLKAGKRAEELTRQLLAYSRKQVLEFKLWDLNAIIVDVEGMLKRLISEDIELSSVPAGAPCLALVDRGQVEQVILNLAVNARDAMPQGGKLILQTSIERLERSYDSQLEVKPGNYVVLSVSDTGEGIAPEVQARLFEPFFTTKEVGKGTGLGLSVVDGIVKQSGGTIAVFSEPGFGTTFRIYFPEAGSASGIPGTLAAEEGEEDWRGEETILLVEDEAMVREFSRLVLEKRGYKVLEAANGVEALRWFQDPEVRIHMVVTDVVMPDMGGQALVSRLSEKVPGLPVLFVSGYSDQGFRQKGGLEPGDRFLQKPFTSGKLARMVRETLQQGKEMGGERKSGA